MQTKRLVGSVGAWHLDGQGCHLACSLYINKPQDSKLQRKEQAHHSALGVFTSSVKKRTTRKATMASISGSVSIPVSMFSSAKAPCA